MPWVTLQSKSGKDGTIFPQMANVKNSRIALQLPELCTALPQRFILIKNPFSLPIFPFSMCVWSELSFDVSKALSVDFLLPGAGTKNS